MDKKYDGLKALVYFTEFGFSLVTPPVLLTALGWYLDQKFHWGSWVIVVGLILGIAASVRTLIFFIKRMSHKR